MQEHPFHVFMEPRSVAVIGASRKTGYGSFNVIENMKEFGFQGKLFPVNPMAHEILGLRSYKHVREIGEPIDLAILSTPREQIPRIVEDCAAYGVKGVIVPPQGFADADEEGKMLQGRLTQIAGKTGIGADAILGNGRQRTISKARRQLMRRAMGHGFSASEIAQFLHCSVSLVSRYCHPDQPKVP